MKNPRIYVEQTISVGENVTLGDNAANHINRVLRMKAGESVRVFSQGIEIQCKIISSERKKVELELLEDISKTTTSALKTTIGLVMSKGDRMDYAVQKAAELGVHRIIPLTSERCELRIKPDKVEKKTQHWQQVAISACEQCGLNNVPHIGEIQSVKDYIEQADSEVKFVLHHRTEKSLQGFDTPQSVNLLIGPEGGLTAQEIALAEQHDFNALCFGPRVLRTETAPVVALSIMQMLWGDF
jgi:16S rRNA (uracil1498-N3)-methyltransferase